MLLRIVFTQSFHFKKKKKSKLEQVSFFFLYIILSILYSSFVGVLCCLLAFLMNFGNE